MTHTKLPQPPQALHNNPAHLRYLPVLHNTRIRQANGGNWSAQDPSSPIMIHILLFLVNDLVVPLVDLRIFALQRIRGQEPALRQRVVVSI
ncbi:hypothetical protein MIND_01381800 [Mycena indigotica]|uniref:Uncharacterized protein n=1 Tax=Mycena indigotica TaxID=2126181 RepID=A0A8H6RYB9_9AGAR|nr:uncharacterized protein MIND_01381800 [Mycena indigotica]KAF7289206.1 hypothetical protein MIND_01381800 [Mycena indigotica]